LVQRHSPVAWSAACLPSTARNGDWERLPRVADFLSSDRLPAPALGFKAAAILWAIAHPLMPPPASDYLAIQPRWPCLHVRSAPRCAPGYLPLTAILGASCLNSVCVIGIPHPWPPSLWVTDSLGLVNAMHWPCCRDAVLWIFLCEHNLRGTYAQSQREGLEQDERGT